jgi:hypothetical protein
VCIAELESAFDKSNYKSIELEKFTGEVLNKVNK